MNASYLEQMNAHVAEGGNLTHQNGVDLLAEVERLRIALNDAKRESQESSQALSDLYHKTIAATQAARTALNAEPNAANLAGR